MVQEQGLGRSEESQVSFLSGQAGDMVASGPRQAAGKQEPRAPAGGCGAAMAGGCDEPTGHLLRALRVLAVPESPCELRDTGRGPCVWPSAAVALVAQESHLFGDTGLVPSGLGPVNLCHSGLSHL